MVSTSASQPGKIPETLPERCSKKDFADLLGIHPSGVSRFIGSGRVILDGSGRILVRDSLARLLATWNPTRGGRHGGGDWRTGTLARIEQLVKVAAVIDAPKVEDAAKLRREMAELRTRLEEAESFRAWYEREVSAGFLIGFQAITDRSTELRRAVLATLDEANAAAQQGPRAWALYFERHLALTVWGWTADEFDEYAGEFFGDDWQDL